MIQSLSTIAWVLLLSADGMSQTRERPFFGVALQNKVLEQRFSRQRSEQEPVSTSLMNTNVTGTQSTVTETRLRFLPDPNRIRFELLNSGDVVSQTIGINRQAKVDSTGRHHFDLIKPMWFDGNIFLTLPCHGTIQASQKPNRVVSAAGAAMPLLSRLGDQVAWNEVMRRQPQINRAVAEDVSRDVLPKVDNLIDADFEKLGKQWRTIQQRAKVVFGDTQLRWSGQSADSVIALWTSPVRTVSPTDRTTLALEEIQVTDDEEIVLFVSEEAVSSLIRQYVPTGLKITDTQLQKLQPTSDGSEDSSVSLASLISLASEFGAATPAEASLFTLEFSAEMPLQVRFVEGDVRVITTFQVHPKGAPGSGWMTTSFNLRGKGVPDDRWAVAVRSVDVGDSAVKPTGIATDREEAVSAPLVIPLENGDPDVSINGESSEPEVQTAEASMAWMTIVRSAARSLAEKLPPVTLPLEFDISGAVPGAPRLRLSKIESADGMLRVSLRIADRHPVASSRN